MKSFEMNASFNRFRGNVSLAAFLKTRNSVLRLGCKLLYKLLYTLLIGILAVTSVQALADSKLHDKYNSLLDKHVVTINDGASTQVNYEGFKRDQKALSEYLNQLAAVPPKTFGSWDKNTQLAFLINAYNAYTINFILTEYPSLRSIRDLGGFFSSPWEKEIAPLLAKSRSLDDIEHNLIRGDNKYSEPRIHFAVNCASVGCPALREEAYIGEQLDKQLEDQTKRFLGDSTRNTMKDNTLYLSKIFTWYEGDFEKNWKGTSTVKEFIVLYREAMSLNQSQVDAITSGEVEVDYLDYDWSLNDVKP